VVQVLLLRFWIGGEGEYIIKSHRECGLSTYLLPNPQLNNAVVTPPSKPMGGVSL